uniref:SCP domain-containing protein n=1 Tax=Parastrongyloides trichosuri TaxID=131310 RepID=A0A0N4ZDW4_PARTI
MKKLLLTAGLALGLTLPLTAAQADEPKEILNVSYDIARELYEQINTAFIPVVDKRGSRKIAQAYLDFLYAPEGQEILASNFNRVHDAATIEKHKANFPEVKLALGATFSDRADCCAVTDRAWHSDGGDLLCRLWQRDGTLLGRNYQAGYHACGVVDCADGDCGCAGQYGVWCLRGMAGDAVPISGAAIADQLYRDPVFRIADHCRYSLSVPLWRAGNAGAFAGEL